MGRHHGRKLGKSLGRFGRLDVTDPARRSKQLDFPAIYYNTPASLAVHADNRVITTPELASGKAIGVGIATTYESYLNRDLKIDTPGAAPVDTVIDNAQIRAYETDQLALDDLKLGDGVKLDAVITALPTVLRAIRDGYPLKIIGAPLFTEPLGVAIDKGDKEWGEKLKAIVADMHRRWDVVAALAAVV